MSPEEGARSDDPIGDGLEGKFAERFQTLKVDRNDASGVTVLTVVAL